MRDDTKTKTPILSDEELHQMLLHPGMEGFIEVHRAIALMVAACCFGAAMAILAVWLLEVW